jgi:hypothetical protein
MTQMIVTITAMTVNPPFIADRRSFALVLWLSMACK